MKRLITAVAFLACLLPLPACGGQSRQLGHAEPRAEEANELGICSLAGSELEERVAEMRTLLAEHCLEAQELEDGYALLFDGGEPVHGLMVELAQKESQCCPSMAWNVQDPHEGRFRVTVTGSSAAKALVRSLVVESTD